jgi:hypothetical protein
MVRTEPFVARIVLEGAAQHVAKKLRVDERLNLERRVGVALHQVRDEETPRVPAQASDASRCVPAMYRNAAPGTCANHCAANMAKPPQPRILMPTAFDGHEIPRTPVRVPSVPLGRCAPDVLGPRTLRAFAKVEFHAVALLQILKAFAIHGAPVKKVLLPRIVLDEPESLFNS